MKKVFEAPMLDVIRFEMKERIAFEEAENEDFGFDYALSEGVENW